MSELALVLTISVGLLGWLAGSSWRHLNRSRADYRTATENKRKAGQTRVSALWSALLWSAALAFLLYLVFRGFATG